MLEDIDEPVEVVAIFKKDVAWPKIVKWNNRTYQIKNLNLVHKVYEGRNLVHYFSVSDKLNSFKLAFNTTTLQWRLKQVYHEG